MPPRQDSSVVLPQPLGPSRITSDPPPPRVQTVDRPDRVPTAGVFDDQVLNAQIAHRSGTSKRKRRIDGHRAPKSCKAGQQTNRNRHHGSEM